MWFRAPNISKFGLKSVFIIVPSIGFKTSLFMKILDHHKWNYIGLKLADQCFALLNKGLQCLIIKLGNLKQSPMENNAHLKNTIN